MDRRILPTIMRGLVVLTAILSVGCESDWVARAARANLASFVTDVVSVAVNETLNP